MARDSDLTMAELAKLAGVSVSTVSRALAGNKVTAEGTREQIVALARQHGFEPNPTARNLRTRRTGTIAVVLPLGHQRDQHLTDPFFMTMIGNLADELTERGFDMLLRRVVPVDSRWASALLAGKRADGLIVLGQSDQHEALNRAADDYPNMVVWGAHLPDSQYLTVGSDNVEGGRLAAQYLIDQGRKSLLMLGHSSVPEFQQRQSGFLERCGQAGVEASALDVDLVPDTLSRQLPSLLRAHDRVNGIFAASDVIAMSAIASLGDSGRVVPGDVSVIGYDRVPLPAYAKGLPATIDQNLPQAAHLLVQVLLDRLAGKPSSSAVIRPTVHVR